MHETSIAYGLVKILLAEAERNHVTQIAKVTIKVGKLKAVEPQSLQFCFDMFVEDTIAAGAELIIDHLVTIARCKSCFHEFEVPAFKFQCTRCSCSDLTIIQGEELFIESFEVSSNNQQGQNYV